MVAVEKHPTYEWILDSGCSFHICLNKDLFKTFIRTDGGKVLLGNNLACKVVGNGTISLRMSDSVIRDLRNIGYVSNLERNLISMGMVD